MLKAARIVLAIVSILALTLLFLDFTGLAASCWPWMARIQFVPALLSANLLALLFLLLLTLVFGRLYCSVICPLGIYQDFVNWLRLRFLPRKKRRVGVFRFKPARTVLRLSFLALFVLLLALGLLNVVATSLAGILDPYSAYGRMASALLGPLWRTGNNVLADFAADSGSYAFYEVPVPAVSFAVLFVAVATLIVVTIFAIRGGRDYCNTICPVGTLLGWLSRFSLLRPVIDTDKCNRCGSCGRKCKASCIDTSAHVIDYSRCVACMDCVSNCSQGAISYSRRRRVKASEGVEKAAPADSSRRAFLLAGAAIGGAVALRAADKTTDGGLTILRGKKPWPDAAPTVPAGAVSLKWLHSHCTACQLCISACPSGILRPATSSLSSFMQPVMVFTDGFCLPSCTACSDICPAGAIRPVTVEEKSSIKIGTAVVDTSACYSATGVDKCGSCARHCPAGAITMVRTVPGDDSSPLRPAVDEAACIGCGSCEYHCPVGTVEGREGSRAAIHVEGLPVHRLI